MSSFSIHELTSSQLANAAQSLANAFQTDPLYSFVVPDPHQRRRWLPLFKREVLRNVVPFRASYFATDSDGQVVAAMAVTRPGSYPHPTWPELRLTLNAILWPSPWCPNLRKLWPLRRYAEVFHEIHYPSPHWYLDVIGVDAAYQQLGIGRQLIARVIEASHQSRLPIWLETQTETNVPFYEALGFQVTVQRHPVPLGPPTWGMLRAAPG